MDIALQARLLAEVVGCVYYTHCANGVFFFGVITWVCTLRDGGGFGV